MMEVDALGEDKENKCEQAPKPEAGTKHVTSAWRTQDKLGSCHLQLVW